MVRYSLNPRHLRRLYLRMISNALAVTRIDDVLKARLKTVGVAEYRFEMEVPMSRDTGTEWRIVDVGGSRSQVSHAPQLLFDKSDQI